eukprot:2060643-Rhodomonas_salina.1
MDEGSAETETAEITERLNTDSQNSSLVAQTKIGRNTEQSTGQSTGQIQTQTYCDNASQEGTESVKACSPCLYDSLHCITLPSCMLPDGLLVEGFPTRPYIGHLASRQSYTPGANVMFAIIDSGANAHYVSAAPRISSLRVDHPT